MTLRATRVCLGLAAFPLFAGGGLAAQGIPVTVGGPLSGFVGQTLQVPIQVDMSARTEKLGSFFIRLQWNPAVLRIDSGVNADFGDIIAREDSFPMGVMRITGVQPAGKGGKVTLGIGFATPLAVDTTTLRVEVLELYAAGSYADLSGSVTAVNRQYCPGNGRYGDLEPDGIITARDAQIALLAAVRLPVPAGTDVPVGDVDGDGQTDTRDALIILSKVVGLNTGPFRILRARPGDCGTDKIAVYAVDPGDQTLVAGQRAQYLLRIADSSANAMIGANVAWSSTTPAVATVSASGEVVAVAPGTAVITATESGGPQASATVIVVASRRKHVVDAAAFNAPNQLGSAVLPFSTIQAGVTFAQAGDTVQVRSGRYEGAIRITRSVTILGASDTGLTRPLISGRVAPPADSSGVLITGGGRVELRGLRFDSLLQSIRIKYADTVIVSDNAFRTRAAFASPTIYVDSVKALRVRRSAFVGSIAPAAFGNGILVTGWVHLLALDSTVMADYGADAININGVDSLLVRRSVFRYNRGYAVYATNASFADSARVMHAVFSRTVMTQNYYGDVYLTDYRSAAFDHNVLVGGGYDGIQLYGDSLSRISFLADTMAIDDGYWLYASNYDSLTVDSVHVRVGYYADVNGGRINVVRNSVFDLHGYSYYAMQVDAYPRDSSVLVVRNVQLLGGTACDRCGDGFYTYGTRVDAEGISADNISQALDTHDGDLLLRNSTFNNVDQAVNSTCGTARVNNITVTNSDYAVSAAGCEPGDSLIVDDITATNVGYAVYANDIDVVVRNSALSDGEYGVYAYFGSLLVEDNQLHHHNDAGVYGYLDSVAVVRRNTITCNAFETGIELSHGALTVRENTLSNCYYGVTVSSSVASVPLGTPAEIRLNTITTAGNAQNGIVSQGTRENVRVVRNTISGPTANASIRVGAGNNPRAIVDSNTITGSAGRGIRSGASDTLRILHNTITDHFDGPCCTQNAAILVETGVQANASLRVYGNRILRSRTHGIVVARSNGNDTVTVQIDSNAVRGTDSIGVWVRYYSRASITRNAIDSSGMDGVRVSENYTGDYCGAATTSTVAQQNNITRSVQFGLRNVIYCQPYAVTADNNWWNDDEGPRCASGCSATGGDSVSTNVAFAPHLTAPVANAPVPVAPLPSPFASAAPAAVTAAPRTPPRDPPAPVARETRERVKARHEAARAAREAARAERMVRPERRAP